MRKNAVMVRVPASTSNLGSGFDTLGLALNLYCTLMIRSQGNRVRLVSGIAHRDRSSAMAMLEETAALFFATTHTPAFGVEIAISSQIPAARGLGASGAIRAGLLAGLARLAGLRLPKTDLLQMTTKLEHHPDNASPAIFGGFTVSGIVENKALCIKFPVSPSLRIVTIVPNFQIATEKARMLLPASYSKADTAHALNRCGLITAAFSSQKYELLRGMLDDRVHQPYRTQWVPALPSVVHAGVASGALGGFLSGSGSAIICLTLHNPEKVAAAMAKAAEGAILVLKPDLKGLCACWM